MKYLLFLFLVCFLAPFAKAQGPDFTVSPNPVCEGQPLNINYNNWSGYQTLDWSFCASNPDEVPDADSLDVPSSNFNKPVFVALAQDPDNGNYHALVSNYDPLPIPPFNRHITRLDFGTEILNPSPAAITINPSPSAPFPQLEGIQLVKEGSNWYGFMVGGQAPPYISQLNFGSNILNASPTRTYMTNQGGLQYPHDLYIFRDESSNEWFGLTVNSGPTQDQGVKDGSVTRFHFNQGLGVVPVGVNLGGFGQLEDPVGIYAIRENNNWYVFITDRWMGLVRLDFGSSLTNNPTSQVIGNLNGNLNRPRDISLLRYCDDIYGFIVNENTAGGHHSLIRIHFEDGITSSPSATPISELDSYFNFPHSISDVLRSGDEMFALITNVLSNNIVRIFFPTCDDDIPAQTGPNPTAVIYNNPGVQTIELIVDLGLPTQENICHDVVINALPTAAMNGGDDICEGETAVIEVNFTGEPPWEFTYTDGDNPQDITTSENPYTLTVSPAETTTYSITALTDNNCTGTNLGGDVIITVTPVDDATFSYSTQTLCTSSPPISPTLADPGTTGIFSATPPGLAINSNTGVIDPSSSTINLQYTVTYTTIGNCPDTAQVTPIIVTDQPEADFFYGSGSFCRNEPVQHPEPASPTASFGTFSASPTGLEINAINGAIDPAQSEPAVYTVTNFIPAADGCPPASYSTEVEIAAIPLPSFIADTVCQGSLTTLTSTSTIPSGQIDEIIWRYNGSNIGFGSEITYDFPEDGDHKVTLRVVSTKGCADEIEQDVLVLRPPAVAPSSVTSPDEFICVGHSNPVGLEVNGGFGDMVEWFTEGCGSDEPFSTTTQPILFLDPPPVETTTYYARWYTNCNVSACDSITITVSPLPEASFEFDTVCFGAPTTFINTSIVEGGEIVEMEWRFEPGIIEITDSDTIQHVFTSSGYHDVTLYAKSEMFCWNGHTQQVYVLPAPEVDLLQQIPPEMQQLSADGDTLYVCIYNSVTLDASDPDNPDQIFDWSVGSQSDTLRIGASGIGYELQYHQVYVTDTISGCVSIADIWVEFSTAACGFGIHDPFSNANIKIYPNPANNLLYVDIKDVVGDINLEIFNIQGKTVKPAYFIQHEELFSIDISDLQPGLYFIRFYNRDMIHSVKLIISRP